MYSVASSKIDSLKQKSVFQKAITQIHHNRTDMWNSLNPLCKQNFIERKIWKSSQKTRAPRKFLSASIADEENKKINNEI